MPPTAKRFSERYWDKLIVMGLQNRLLRKLGRQLALPKPKID
jgi:hypothetical protein